MTMKEEDDSMKKGMKLIQRIKQRPADDYVVFTLLFGTASLSLSGGLDLLICTDWSETLSMIFIIIGILMLIVTEIIVIFTPKSKFLPDVLHEQLYMDTADTEDTQSTN